MNSIINAIKQPIKKLHRDTNDTFFSLSFIPIQGRKHSNNKHKTDLNWKIL